MRNPLNKRLPRELKKDIGKYVVIFLFMAATIGFVSGFLVAGNSMMIAYNNSFSEYNIEDGHFTVSAELPDSVIEKLADEIDAAYADTLQIYALYSKDESVGEDYTWRIFKNRTDINRVCVMEGKLAEEADEIAVDRLFAENNDIDMGDIFTIGNRTFTVCGFISASDYSALFRSNADTMFDAQNFTVAMVSEKAFNSISDVHLKYTYAWSYGADNLSEKDKKDRAETIMTVLAKNAVLTDFVAEPDNQAIHFTGDDMGSDTSMMICLLYIVIVIMAFVFAITTSNTIEQESAVIGTLRASGYTRKELVLHYLYLPVLVTLIGAVVGNILGYTVFKNIVVSMYYGSYSLPVYTTVWSSYAFVMTTIIPCVIMLVLNLLILSNKMLLSPLRFLRHDLKVRKKKKAVRLPAFKFMTRFRLRIIFQNASSYCMMLVGILFANIILLFGMMMTPLLVHYKNEVLNHMVSEYQYILKAPVETEHTSAEKFAVNTLKPVFENREYADEITIYGICENSDYIQVSTDPNPSSRRVVVSDGILQKYGLKVGDSIQLRDKYGEKSYDFEIMDHFYYPAGLAVFMDINAFCDAFDYEEGYFSGYFSNTAVKDIDEKYIAATITQSDMTILADQLFDSMGNMFPMVSAFSVLLYMLLVYLLSKIIIEKNAASVSVVKILGYQNKEITGLYVASTAAVVVLSELISLPAAYVLIGKIFVFIISSYSGWFEYYIEPSIFPKMFLLGIAAYAVVGALQFRKIKRIPMEEALKNVD